MIASASKLKVRQYTIDTQDKTTAHPIVIWLLGARGKVSAIPIIVSIGYSVG